MALSTAEIPSAPSNEIPRTDLSARPDLEAESGAFDALAPAKANPAKPYVPTPLPQSLIRHDQTRYEPPVTEPWWGKFVSAVGGFFKGAGELIYTIVCEDFVKTACALWDYAKGEVGFFVGAVKAGFALAMGDKQGFNKHLNEAFKSRADGIQALKDNWMHIAFAVAAVVATVFTAGTATAGVFAVRAALKEGLKAGIKQIAKVAVEELSASVISKLAAIPKLKNALPIGKVALKQFDEIGELLAKNISDDLVDAAKMAAREDSMGDAAKAILKANVDEAIETAEKLDIHKIEEQLLNGMFDKKGVLKTPGLKKIVSDDTCELVAGKIEKILNLVADGKKSKVETLEKLKEMGIPDADLEALYKLIDSRELRIVLKSGKFDDDLIQVMTKALQEGTSASVDEALKSGKLGSRFLSQWDEYVDELSAPDEITGKAKITKQEADELKAAARRANDKAYKEGVEEGIERGVKEGFRRFRKKHESDEDVIPDATNKKQKETKRLEAVARREQAGKSRISDGEYSQSEQEALREQIQTKQSIHWLNMFFNEFEKSKASQTLKGQANKTRTEVDRNLIDQIDQIGKDHYVPDSNASNAESEKVGI